MIDGLEGFDTANKRIELNNIIKLRKKGCFQISCVCSSKGKSW